MTILSRERLVSAQLVRDLSAMTFALPLDLELLVCILVVDPVGCTMLPLIFLTVRGVARLVLMPLCVIVLCGAVGHPGLLIGRFVARGGGIGPFLCHSEGFGSADLAGGGCP
jgi:hypothetical protein